MIRYISENEGSSSQENGKTGAGGKSPGYRERWELSYLKVDCSEASDVTVGFYHNTTGNSQFRSFRMFLHSAGDLDYRYNKDNPSSPALDLKTAEKVILQIPFDGDYGCCERTPTFKSSIVSEWPDRELVRILEGFVHSVEQQNSEPFFVNSAYFHVSDAHPNPHITSVELGTLKFFPISLFLLPLFS